MAEVMLVALIMMAMSVIAYGVINTIVAPARYAEFQVRLENGAPPNPSQGNTFNTVKVVIYHMGGDIIGIPDRDDDEFRVVGSHFGENSWENTVAWDNWEFSAPLGGFEFGENVVGYLVHDDARTKIGDKVRIIITDLYADKIAYMQNLTVKNSLLW